MKKYLFILLLFFFISVSDVYGIYNPQDFPNNRFGIHIIEQADLDQATKLVNSSGGLWGYITFVIRDDQRQVDQWSDFFRQLRQKNLIPIVRIATHVENGVWVKPKLTDGSSWADFFDHLPWPVENRYIILFNEPNHAKEWGSEINPNEYTDIVNQYIKAFKNVSSDFFMLNAGFDMAAQAIPNQTADALWYWEKMDEYSSGIFSQFDGWVSHAYPNPNFTASPYNNGRTSIVSYRFEQDYLSNNYQVNKKPVFITETGWQTGILNESIISSYYEIAFENIWKDNNLIAVTPFLLNYPEQLFATFSWIDLNGKPKEQYNNVLGMVKYEGNPIKTPVSWFGKLTKKLKASSSVKISSLPNLLF